MSLLPFRHEKDPAVEHVLSEPQVKALGATLMIGFGEEGHFFKKRRFATAFNNLSKQMQQAPLVMDENDEVPSFKIQMSRRDEEKGREALGLLGSMIQFGSTQRAGQEPRLVVDLTLSSQARNRLSGACEIEGFPQLVVGLMEEFGLRNPAAGNDAAAQDASRVVEDGGLAGS